MSVMKCDRKSCNNIMCDTYINGYYICSDCKSEFSSDYLAYENKSEKEWYRLFHKFLSSEKLPGDKYKTLSIDEFLNQGNIDD